MEASRTLSNICIFWYAINAPISKQVMPMKIEFYVIYTLVLTPSAQHSPAYIRLNYIIDFYNDDYSNDFLQTDDILNLETRQSNVHRRMRWKL